MIDPSRCQKVAPNAGALAVDPCLSATQLQWSRQQVLRHFPLSPLCRWSGLIFSMTALWSAKLKVSYVTPTGRPQSVHWQAEAYCAQDLPEISSSNLIGWCYATLWNQEFTNEDEFYELFWWRTNHWISLIGQWSQIYGKYSNIKKLCLRDFEKSKLG